MLLASFQIEVSHGQFSVFCSSIPNPFNDWTDEHVSQGFSWRPGSVSFRTVCESGLHCVHVEAGNERTELCPSAVRVIEVPFDVPDDGAVEVGGIPGTVSLSLPAGRYELRCEFDREQHDNTSAVLLRFLRNDAPGFRVLRADDALSPPQELVKNASPAGC